MRAVFWSRRVPLEVGKRFEFNCGKFTDGVECRAFNVARVSQTSVNKVEISVVVAGMRDQFPCAGRHAAEQGTKCRGVENACAGHRDSSAGGDKSFFLDDPPG